MPKPVLYLTNDTTAALALIMRNNAVQAFNATQLRGLFDSGEEFYIKLATQPAHANNLAGMEFSRYEIVGNRLLVDDRCIEVAKQRIRP